jgi:predicted transcriptional regulator
MARTRPAQVTAAELRLLEELWRRGEATVRDLRDAIYPDGGNSKFATVQTLLTRLSGKALVRRRDDGGNWVYGPAVSRDAWIGGELRRVADRLGGRSLTPLLTHLIEGGGLTAAERAHLRKLLDDEPGG